jgi:hypothetical protein
MSSVIPLKDKEETRLLTKRPNVSPALNTVTIITGSQSPKELDFMLRAAGQVANKVQEVVRERAAILMNHTLFVPL